MLVIHFSQSFTINLYGDLLMAHVIVTTIIGFVLEITFLVLVFTFKKLGVVGVATTTTP